MKSNLSGIATVRRKFWSLALGATLSVSSAHAAVYTYNGSASTSTSTAPDEWSTGTNWTAAPVSATTTELTFTLANTTAVTVYTNNDITGTGANGNFLLNILDLAGTGSTTGTSTVNISGNALEFAQNGTVNPVVNLTAAKGTGGATSLGYNVANNLVLDANTTFQGSGIGPFTFNGNISGTGAITKTGNSALVFNGTNTFGALTANGAITFQKTGTGTNTINGNVTSTTTGLLTFGGVTTITGNITAGNLTNVIFLSNGNTVSGTVTINSGGILQLGNNTAAGNLLASGGGGAAIIDNGTFALNVAGTQNPKLQGTDFGAISGSGALLQENTDVVTLNAANSYTGATNITGTGTLKMGATNSLPATTVVTIGNGTTTKPILDLGGFSQTITSLTSSFTTGSATVTSTGATGTTATLTVNGSGTANNSTFAGVIQNGTGTGTLGTTALAKAGTSVLTLSGANTYTGGTAISGGSLLVNNTSGSGLGTGAVTVSGTGVLGGGNGAAFSGTTSKPGTAANAPTLSVYASGVLGVVSGAVTANSGGTLNPGSGSTVGTLTVGALTLNTGAGLTYQFNSTTNSFVAVTGALTMAGTSSLTFLQEGTSTAFSTAGIYDLFSYGAGSTINTANLSVANAQSGFNYSFVNDTTDSLVQLDITTAVVPEPGTWISGVSALTMAMAAWLRRRSGLMVRV